MKRVLVTNAGGRLGMGVSRALKAAPEPLFLIGVDAHEIQLHRAVTHEKHLVPRADAPDYLPVLRRIVEETQAEFLWVNHEAEIAVLAKAAASAIGIPTFLPSYEVVALCQDKMASNQRFQAAGVPVPESMLISSRADLRQAFRRLGQRLWLRAIRGTGGKGSLPVSDFNTATKWIDLHRGWGNFMAAELLAPETITWESIWNRGELVAAQGRRRLYWEFSSMTLSGVTGVGGAHRWVADPDVRQLGIRAVKAVAAEPHGIFSVDFTYDWGGMPKATEINCGRFMSGGVICIATPDYNMPYLAIQIALGNKLPDTSPLLDYLPKDTVLIHGMDTEPVFVGLQEVQRCSEELQRRRGALVAAAAPVAAAVGSGLR